MYHFTNFCCTQTVYLQRNVYLIINYLNASLTIALKYKCMYTFDNFVHSTFKLSLTPCALSLHSSIKHPPPRTFIKARPLSRTNFEASNGGAGKSIFSYVDYVQNIYIAGLTRSDYARHARERLVNSARNESVTELPPPSCLPCPLCPILPRSLLLLVLEIFPDTANHHLLATR